jgi:hypothetical protein
VNLTVVVVGGTATFWARLRCTSPMLVQPNLTRQHGIDAQMTDASHLASLYNSPGSPSTAR